MTMIHARATSIAPSDVRPRILVAIDGGAASRAALRWTADRAGSAGADIRLVTVIDPARSSAMTFTEQHTLDGSRIVMETITENSAVDTELRTGDPSREIVAAAVAFDANLIVIGTHATQADERPVLKSVPGRVASRAHVPVAIVPVGWMPRAGTAVVGWSTDSAAGAAVEFAAKDARRNDGSILLVHVWDLPSTGAIPVEAGGAESIPERQTAYLDRVGAEWATFDPHLRVRTEVRHGHASVELLAAAAHARVLVVGRRARSAASRLLLGSVSRGVLSAPPCPVVVVPAPAPGLHVTPDIVAEDL